MSHNKPIDNYTFKKEGIVTDSERNFDDLVLEEISSRRIVLCYNNIKI